MTVFARHVTRDGINILRSPSAGINGYTEASIVALKRGLRAPLRQTPQEFTYNDEGSLLFDSFVDSPPYYLPKKEIEILERYSNSIANKLGGASVHEIGSGSGKKTAILLKAVERKTGGCIYYPMDINEKIMLIGARKIKSDIPNIEITCVAGTYDDIFEEPLPGPKKRALLLLGSGISQEQDDKLLVRLRQRLDVGDYFVIAYDRLKDPEILCSAYDHPAAAALSHNVLKNLNDNFGADFLFDQFEFFVRYNSELEACETGQRSLVDQSVRIEAVDLTVNFSRGDILRTGLQRKFEPLGLQRRIERIGFERLSTYSDDLDWYSISTFVAR